MMTPDIVEIEINPTEIDPEYHKALARQRTDKREIEDLKEQRE